MRGAIFDMDGLLLDTERIYQQTWREMAAEYGVALDGRFTADIIGISRAGSLAVIARYLPMVDPDAFVTEGSRRVYEKEAAGIPLMPGVRTILEGLRGLGFGLAVASSSGTEMVLRNLRVAGLDPYFDAVVSGQDVQRGKPAPDIFLYAAQRLGLDAAQCYVFEDSLNGIRAGHAAGSRAIMIPDLVAPTEEVAALCAAIFPDLGAAWEAIRDGAV